MSSTKALSPSTATLAARVLKTAGIIIFVATLLDMIILPMPYNIGDRQWQINFATQVVDRGIVPLVGLVLFLTGCWIGGSAKDADMKRSLALNPRFWACLLASILGLFYLLIFPWHLNNVRVGNQEALEQVNQQATQAESQLSGDRLQAEIEAQRQQITQLVNATDEQLKQLETAGQLSKEQADLIRQFKADPKSVDPFLQQREQELRNQLQTQIGVGKEQQQKRIQTEALKSGIRVSISSLLLAIGFAVIGWTGLRNLQQP